MKGVVTTIRELARGIIIALWMIASIAAASANSITNSPLAVPALLTHKIQISDPALARQIEAEGGHLIANYGTYQLYEVSELSAQMARQPKFELRDNYNFIMLHAGPLDTRKPEVRALRQSIAPFTGKRLHLIQFAGPIRSEWRQQLLATGVQIICYLPQNSYLIYGDAASLARLQTFASPATFIQWEGTYLNDYKIHPRARATDENGQPRPVGTGLFDIQLVADSSANPATLRLLDHIKLGPFKRQSQVLSYLDIVVPLGPKTLRLIAAQPDVISILPYFPRHKLDERQDQISAGNLAGTVPSGPGYLAWLTNAGFRSAQFTNFIVDLTDSGVDNGTISPQHFGLYAGGNTANPSRIVYSRYESTVTNTTNSVEGCDGHGTIDAHIICGYDDFPGFPFADTNGFHYGLGICPFVSIGCSVAFDSAENDIFYYPNFNNLQADAYQSGARISNNSWGSDNSEGIYDSEAQNYDALVRDAEPTNSTHPAPGNQQMVIVFAAGNDGSGDQTLNSPGSAKNVITVGAAESVQAFGGTDRSFVSDQQADNANDIASFSSRGPSADGRIKPDIMAPGTHISGGLIQATNDFINYPNGIADPCFNGSYISCGPDGALFWPTNQQFYTASSGTSQSAPCVSGACALVMQYFINTWSNLPSPAMTKAYLLNSARYLTGAYGNDSLPSNVQGMGELNLGMAFDGAPRILRDQIAADVFTNSGQLRAITGHIASINRPFRVTLAWTDAPGSLTGNAYNNDLDLTVTIGTNTYKGNVFNGAYSTTGGSADFQNNVESVYLPAGVSGDFVVNVAASSINSVGVPNTNNLPNQDFAIVIYNAVAAPLPMLTPTGVVLTAEGCQPTNGLIDPGETVTVNFGFQNIGTVNFSNLIVTLQTNSGVAPGSGQQSFAVLPAAGSAVSAPFTFTANGGCGGSISTVFQVWAGSSNLGTFTYSFPLGQFMTGQIFSENFDEAPAPALPPQWISPGTISPFVWITSTNEFDTPFNAVFAVDTNMAGVNELDSPIIPILTTNAQLNFMNNYDLESDPAESAAPTNARDGGVLEIKLDNGPFMDILAAGGSFNSGGYLAPILGGNGNPLSGRQSWSGNSQGFVYTSVNLPAVAAGHNIQLRWLCGTDIGNPNGGIGWYIDTLSINDGFYSCCTPPVPPAILNPQISGTSITFSFQTVKNQVYYIQETGNLANPSWNTIQYASGDGTVQTVTDNLSTPQQFYRIISP